MRTIRLKRFHALSKALRSLSFPEKEFSLAPPKISEFGDLSSNIALLLARDLNKPPMDICKSIADELDQTVICKVNALTNIEKILVKGMLDMEKRLM